MDPKFKLTDRMIRRTVLILGLLVLWRGAPLSAQVPPDARWRTLETEHFRVSFPARLGVLAPRAGRQAEEAFDALAESFTDPPPGKIDLILTDHVDLTNGFADLTPWKRITVFARPPVDGFALIYFDDWLKLVLVHELAHVFHLDMTGRLGSVLRGVFGRLPAPWPVFPQRGLPTWAVEGLATYFESTLTDAGRLNGTFHEMMLRTAVLEDAFEEIDQASGESPIWPAGDRSYLYGSRFFEYLVSRNGGEGLESFAEAVSNQWIPYRLNAAGEDAFGISLSQAWSEWSDSLETRYSALIDTLASQGPLTEPRPVSARGRLALHPRVSPDGRLLAWSNADGVSDPQLRVAAPDGQGVRKLTRVNGSTALSWTPDGDLVFSQLEFEDPYRIRRDLYRAALDGGVRRLTSGLRLSQPDVHPDGRTAVAVQDGEGSNRLVLVELRTGELRAITPFDPGVHWAYPRWSPDGRWVAVGRWESGAYYDVTVLDGEGREALRLTRDRAVDLSPAWSPDGSQVLWSSDRTGIPNLFAARVDPGAGTRSPLRQVTNLTTGGWFPSVDPEGRWIYLSVYHADGWRAERIAYRPEEWFEPFPEDPRFRQHAQAAPDPAPLVDAEPATDDQGPPGREYSAFPSLLPHYWEPLYQTSQKIGSHEVIGSMLGAATGGSDVVGRHEYAAWLRAETDADRRVEGSVSYRFAGLGNPVLGVAAGQFHDARGRFRLERPDTTDVVDTVFLTERERQLGASVTYRRPRIRSFLSATVSGSWVREERFTFSDDPVADTLYRPRVPRSDLVEGALTLGYTTARGHPFSVSREDGVAGFVRLRGRRDVGVEDSLSGSPGDDRGFEEVAGRVQLFKGIQGPGFANHVLALRLSGGVAGGPGADRLHFELGGASGRAENLTGFALFGGSGLLFPVRGYPEAYRAGRYAWTGSLEYRMPLALVHRGLGTFPLYLDRLSAGVFLDGGNAWGPEIAFAGYDPNPRARTLWSTGVELLGTTLPLWAAVLELRVGVAFPLVEARDPGSYLRLGWSF